MTPAPPPTPPRGDGLAPVVRRGMLHAAGLFYPAPGRPAAPPRSILLLRPDHLGDILFLTPALRALRAAQPGARITALTGPWGRAALQDNPDLDAVETCPFPGFARQPKANLLAPYRLLFKQARALRGRGFDTAVVLRFDHWWGAWLAAAAGIPRRVGYDRSETRPFLTQALPYTAGRHEVEQNGALLAALSGPGAAWELGPTRFAIAEGDRTWVDGWLQGRGLQPGAPLVAVHAGAGAAVKLWPTTAWARVADALAEEHDARILLTGSAEERDLTRSIAETMTHPAFDAAGQTTLGQLAALLERCTLVLGSDSGPLHLAVAAGPPTVHLYGPVAADTFGPWGDPARHIVLTTRWPCAPCNRLDWTPDVLAQHRCLADIAPEQVLGSAQRLLHERKSVK
jgi:lipopolysaccharide heptosyltransferase II